MDGSRYFCVQDFFPMPIYCTRWWKSHVNYLSELSYMVSMATFHYPEFCHSQRRNEQWQSFYLSWLVISESKQTMNIASSQYFWKKNGQDPLLPQQTISCGLFFPLPFSSRKCTQLTCDVVCTSHWCGPLTLARVFLAKIKLLILLISSWVCALGENQSTSKTFPLKNSEKKLGKVYLDYKCAKTLLIKQVLDCLQFLHWFLHK